MEKENVIEKVKKLLRLQFNAETIGNEGEAFQAAKMVRKLLMENGLNMGDIDLNEKRDLNIETSDDVVTQDRYGQKWRLHLLNVISDNNLCKIYGRGAGRTIVVGAPENVAVVKEFYAYLVHVFTKLSDRRWCEKIERMKEVNPMVSLVDRKELAEIRGKFVRSYLEGAPYGLQENYESLKPTSQETALMVCHAEQIDSYVKKNFKVMESKRKLRSHATFGDAFMAGVNGGKQVSLNKQIAGGEDSKALK